MKEMTLEIKNFGPINHAKLDIGKINIIAGQNASGKTTSSKLFYCLLASVSSDGEYLADRGIIQRMTPLLFAIGQIIAKEYPVESDKLLTLSASLNDINSMYNMPGISVRDVYDQAINLIQSLKFKNKEDYEQELSQLNILLDLKDDKKAIYEYIIHTLLEIEFDGPEQIVNNFNNSEVNLYGKKKDCIFKNKIITKENRSDVKLSNDFLDCIGITEVSYIETPYIFDFFTAVDYDFPFFRANNYHQKLLMRKLRDVPNKEDVYDKVVNKKIIQFKEKIDKLIDGHFNFDKDKQDFNFEKDNKSFTIKNTAAGLKQIGIIQLLLENRKLLEKSYLIMDEPEVHLHPEWQIKLAEIIVLLAKDLDITLYINSHSPQFIEAIEVYSKYNDIQDETNFYITQKEENGKFIIDKIENNEIKKIYKNLGDPYDIIDEINGYNMIKDIKGSD